MKDLTLPPAPLLATALILGLSACAKQPDQIAPARIVGHSYGTASCAGLSTHLNARRDSLLELTAAQEAAASGDAMGMVLIGLPVASMAGKDQEPAIAEVKGHIRAIEGAQHDRKCAP